MRIIKKPVITEKSLSKYADEHKVTFEVALNADKISASKSLERIFGVKLLEAKVSSRLGKTKYNRLTRRASRQSDKKIMIFKLDDASKIDLFEIKND